MKQNLHQNSLKQKMFRGKSVSHFLKQLVIAQRIIVFSAQDYHNSECLKTFMPAIIQNRNNYNRGFPFTLFKVQLLESNFSNCKLNNSANFRGCDSSNWSCKVHYEINV